MQRLPKRDELEIGADIRPTDRFSANRIADDRLPQTKTFGLSFHILLSNGRSKRRLLVVLVGSMQHPRCPSWRPRSTRNVPACRWRALRSIVLTLKRTPTFYVGWTRCSFDWFVPTTRDPAVRSCRFSVSEIRHLRQGSTEFLSADGHVQSLSAVHVPSATLAVPSSVQQQPRRNGILPVGVVHHVETHSDRRIGIICSSRI